MAVGLLDKQSVKFPILWEAHSTVCNWFAQGLKEFEVMRLAGHADFRTTHKFYLAVVDDLKGRVRRANV